MKVFLTAILFFVSTNVFAAEKSISDAEVIRAAKSDSIARAAFGQATSKECKATVTKKPLVQYDMFQINIQCTSAPDQYTGGGLYLNITIDGQYWGNGAADVQKIEIQRAG